MVALARPLGCFSTLVRSRGCSLVSASADCSTSVIFFFSFLSLVPTSVLLWSRRAAEAVAPELGAEGVLAEYTLPRGGGSYVVGVGRSAESSNRCAEEVHLRGGRVLRQVGDSARVAIAEVGVLWPWWSAVVEERVTAVDTPRGGTLGLLGSN